MLAERALACRPLANSEPHIPHEFAKPIKCEGVRSILAFLWIINSIGHGMPRV